LEKTNEELNPKSLNNFEHTITPHGTFHYSWGWGGYWWAAPIVVDDANFTFKFGDVPETFTFSW